jgi:predicted transcriptional regulator
MTSHLKEVLERVETWSEQDQEKLAQVILEVEAQLLMSDDLTPEQLKAIDEGVAAADRGEIASDEQVKALFAKFRRS